MKRYLTYKLLLLLFLTLSSFVMAQEEIYIVERAPFSSRSSNEDAPVIYQGGIVFTADIRITYTTQRTDASGRTAVNLFRVQKIDEENWTDPELFSEDLHNVNAHTGWLVFNDRGNRIFYNTNQEKIGKEDAKQGIFTAGFAGGQWTGIQPFVHNDPSYNLFHPFLSPDGTMLFFSSDMKGGYGQTDLYVCVLDRSTWSEPINLGPEVNSRRREGYPVYLENGRLYFSSNGHEGLGKADIFFTEKIDGKWITPVHLPEPFNSKRDDVSFIPLDTANMTGYLTSNRDRARTMSIYEIKLDIPKTLFVNCRQQEENNFCYEIQEEGTMAIDTTNLMYEWLIDGKKFRAEVVDYCFPGPGNYKIQLNVLDMLSGEVMFNEADHDLVLENIEQAYIVSPDTIYVDETVILDATETYLSNFETERFVWNTGDLNYAAESVITYSYYKPGVYTIRLGVTDEADTPEENRQTCSFKRLVVLPLRQDPLSDNE
jgi:hypothetical protein